MFTSLVGVRGKYVKRQKVLQQRVEPALGREQRRLIAVIGPPKLRVAPRGHLFLLPTHLTVDHLLMIKIRGETDVHHARVRMQRVNQLAQMGLEELRGRNEGRRPLVNLCHIALIVMLVARRGAEKGTVSKQPEVISWRYFRESLG